MHYGPTVLQRRCATDEQNVFGPAFRRPLQADIVAHHLRMHVPTTGRDARIYCPQKTFGSCPEKRISRAHQFVTELAASLCNVLQRRGPRAPFSAGSFFSGYLLIAAALVARCLNYHHPPRHRHHHCVPIGSNQYLNPFLSMPLRR